MIEKWPSEKLSYIIIKYNAFYCLVIANPDKSAFYTGPLGQYSKIRYDFSRWAKESGGLTWSLDFSRPGNFHPDFWRKIKNANWYPFSSFKPSRQHLH